MTDLLCMFTQVVYDKAPWGDESKLLIAAPDMLTAQNVAADAIGENWGLTGPCKIIKGARISGESRVILGDIA